jgi:hypothetical protein
MLFVAARTASPSEEDEMNGERLPVYDGEIKRKRLLTSIGLVAGGLVAGGILAGTQLAGAQTGTAATTAPVAAVAAANTDPATVNHGPNETLLTGTTADKVTAAALAAVPGATVIRVETDSDGSPYEAHLKKADGSMVTVKVGKDFKVTSTQTGFGGRRGHAHDAASSSAPAA